MSDPDKQILSHGQLLQLKRWNTPTIYNGWEKITSADSARDAFNLEPTTDFMPQMGPMIGYAVTLVIEPSNPEHKTANPNAFDQYMDYIASVPGPKIVVVQDLDRPHAVGSLWGEVGSNLHKAFGCVGTITDGAIRDHDEMVNAGFKAIARQLCVAHACVFPIRWNCEVKVFGRKVLPGQLIHADKHGFLAIPHGEEARLLEAAEFLDKCECEHLISPLRNVSGLTTPQKLQDFRKNLKAYLDAVNNKYPAPSDNSSI